MLTAFLLYIWKSSTVLGFVVYSSSSSSSVVVYHSARTTTTTELFVVKKGGANSNTKSKSSNQLVNTKGGGFGRITGTIPKIDDDYRIFPALESRVRDTLIPATTTTVQESDGTDVPLSSEIYQRLDQIYGFPLFNFKDESILSSLSNDEPIQRSPLDLLLNNDFSGDGDDDLISNTKSTKAGIDTAEVLLPLEELPHFPKVHVLHIDPMVLSIDNFFTPEECEQYIQKSESKKSLGNNGGIGNTGSSVMESRSPTVGKDATAKAQRTSTTFYHKYDSVPELISKASRLLGIPTIHQWEEPQTVRYRKNEKFTWHLDALGPNEQQSSSSGQRTATLLVYLTDMNRTDGGATLFRDLGNFSTTTATETSSDGKYLRVQPKQGMALLFFPSAGGIVDCPFDIRTLHCGEVITNNAICDKWIAQLWLRQRPYTPTAPPGNLHCDAYPAIIKYCQQYATK